MTVADKPTMDLYGMRVAVSEVFPPNMIAMGYPDQPPSPFTYLFASRSADPLIDDPKCDRRLFPLSPTGRVPHDKPNGIAREDISSPDVKVSSKDREVYNVEDHTLFVSEWKSDPLAYLHDSMELAWSDDLLATQYRDRLRRRTDKMMQEALYGSVTTNITPNPPLATMDLAALEARVLAWMSDDHKMKVKLVEALASCGLKVRVTKGRDGNLAVLPSEYTEAAREARRNLCSKVEGGSLDGVLALNHMMNIEVHADHRDDPVMPPTADHDDGVK